MRSLYKIAAVTQQILLNDLTHSLVAQPFCHPNDWMKIFGIKGTESDYPYHGYGVWISDNTSK